MTNKFWDALDHMPNKPAGEMPDEVYICESCGCPTSHAGWKWDKYLNCCPERKPVKHHVTRADKPDSAAAREHAFLPEWATLEVGYITQGWQAVITDNNGYVVSRAIEQNYYDAAQSAIKRILQREAGV